MDENNNNSGSFFDVDDDEGATTVLTSGAPISEEEDDEEGATTVLTGPDPVSVDVSTGNGKTPKFNDKTVLVQPGGMQTPGGNGMPGPASMGPNGTRLTGTNGMAPVAPAGITPNGMQPMGTNGMGPNGMQPNGMQPMGPNGMAPNGMGPNGMQPMGPNGMAPNGMQPNGMQPMGPNGMAPNGMQPMGPNGMAPNGMQPMGPNGMGLNGMGPNGMQPMGPNGMAPNGMQPMGPNGMAPNGMAPNGKPPKQKKEKAPKQPKPAKEPKLPKEPKQPKQPKAPKNPGKKKKKTGLIVALCFVLVLGLGAGAYFLFFTPEKRYERNLAKADEAVAAQNYEEAEDAYEKALEIFDDRVVAINGLIKAEIELGELDDAREDFETYRAAISAFDADKISENREEIVHFYEKTGSLYDDCDTRITIYGEGYKLTGDAVIKEVYVNALLERADGIDMADYDAKIEAYTDVLDVDSANVDALSGRVECAYAVLDDMMLAEQYDDAETFISNYESAIPDADFSSYTERIESERALANARHDVMEQTISLMAAGDYEGMLSVDGSENASLVVDNMEGDSYIYAQDGFSSTYTGKAAGIYQCADGYYFYYGDYENGVRSGQGTLFVKLDGYNGTYELYEGAWSNDKPNGAGTVSLVNDSTDSGYITTVTSGNFVDGLLDGEVSMTLTGDDGTYSGAYTATAGTAPDVRVDYPDGDFSNVPEGRTVFVILSNEDNSYFWWFSYTEGQTLGAYGFRSN